MRKIFLIILCSTSLSFLIYPFLYRNTKSKDIIEVDFNNLEEFIPESISPSCSNISDKNHNNSLSSLNTIKVNIPNSRGWSKNLLNAKLSTGKIIKNKYKKIFLGNIFIKNNNNKLCKLPAKIRLSGDWKDHIEFKGKNIFASLDIKLLKGNINGIIRFKLFLPSTRNDESEVITALLLEKMGYLSPRTKIIDVNINGGNQKMIFQEKATKELLEYNNLRESTIIESDESILWESRINSDKSYNGYIFPKVLNSNWLKKGVINKEISINALNLFSKAIVDSWIIGEGHKDQSFSDQILSNNNKLYKQKLSRFKVHLLAMRASHALHNHNRRFYYDPIYESLVPIYYDGNSKILKSEELNIEEINFIKKNSLLREIENKDIDYAIKEVEQVNLLEFKQELNNLGLNLTTNNILNIKNNLIKNLNILKKENYTSKKLSISSNTNPLKMNINPYVKYKILFLNKNSKFIYCDPLNNKCNEIKLKDSEINDLLEGKLNRNKTKFFYLGNSYNPYNNKYSIFVPRKINKNIYINNISIKPFGMPKIKIKKNEKIIYIELNNPNDKVLISSKYMENWKIKLENNLYNNKKLSGRFDKNLLTSSLTIKDSYINGLEVYINGGYLEDSLNIIGSEGFIDLIKIEDSYQDAIDFDFSNLKIDKIYVNNSGNDCLDMSYGNYFVNYINANSCKDKAISAGENSNVEIKNALIKNSKFALVSKDSSTLNIKDGFLQNNQTCIAAYNKKQEFGPSRIISPKNICSKEKIKIQNLSTLIMK